MSNNAMDSWKLFAQVSLDPVAKHQTFRKESKQK